MGFEVDEQEYLRLKKEVESCLKCELYKSRTHVVVGEGALNAKIMLIGEAPGYWEDLEGRPFVGAAGKFLDRLLSIADLSRSEVYITNIVKCRPPKNREPKIEEMKTCTISYLDRQLALIKPKLILTLGNVATLHILDKFGFKPQSIGKIHGKIFETVGLRLIPLHHPAMALYNPSMKKVMVEDWKKIGIKQKV